MGGYYVNEEVRKMYGIPLSQLTPEQREILRQDGIRRAKLIEERQKDFMRNNKRAFEDAEKLNRVLASIYGSCQKEILGNVAETIAKVKKAGGEWSYANQSALTRSRGLFEQINKELVKLGKEENTAFRTNLQNIYTDQFLRTLYSLGQTQTINSSFAMLNPRLIQDTLDYPWSGAMFSDRLWLDKDRLGRNLRVGLTQSMILGEDMDKIADRVGANINTSKYNAMRVARTETKRVTYSSQAAAFADQGVDEVRYMAANNGGDSRTCDLCREDHGKKFKLGEEPSLPRHPNCRCWYIPVTRDTFEENELNELTGSVRGAENYEKWREKEEARLKAAQEVTGEKSPQALIAERVERDREKFTEQRKEAMLQKEALEEERKKVLAEQRRGGSVRRGLMSPEEGGWKSQADFDEWERALKEKEKSLMDKIRDIDKNMLQLSIKEGDLLLDISYVGDSKARYDSLELFRSTRVAHRENLSFDMDKYKDEFVKMSQRMDKEALIVQDKMAKYAAKNSYNLKNTGWYNWGKVEMDMSSNQHEKALKNGLIGSWQTKYHEEGHQIDHLLGKVAKFCDNPVKGFYACMTNSECSVGNAMGKAIEKDLLAFVNDAVSYVNKQGRTCKSLKSFARIPYEVKEATIDYLNYLTSNRADEVTKCRLGILTDALGCYTEGKLHPYGFGFWGHKFKYCKSVKKNGAISETWATFCALRVCGSPEEIEEVKKIMPNTWENMSKVYSEIAEYLLTHDI